MKSYIFMYVFLNFTVACMSEIYLMIIFFVFTISALVEYVVHNNDRANLKYLRLAFSLLAIFIYTVIAGFREVGFSPDDINYSNIFYNIVADGGGVNEATNEPLFIWLNKIVSFLTSDVSNLFLLFAFLTALLTASSFLLSSQLVILSFTLYLSHVFLYRDMIQIRAGLSYSLAMFIISVYLINLNKRWYFYPFTIVPGFIHTSGFLTLFVPFLSKIKYSAKLSWTLILMSLILGLVDFGKQISEVFSLFDFGAIQSAVNTYVLTQNKFNYELGILNPTTLKQVFWLFLFNLNLKALSQDKSSTLMLWMYTISTCILLLLNNYSTLAARLASLFSISEFFLIPLLVTYSKKKSLVFFILAIVYCAAMLLLNLFSKNLFSGYHFNFY